MSEIKKPLRSKMSLQLAPQIEDKFDYIIRLLEEVAKKQGFVIKEVLQVAD